MPLKLINTEDDRRYFQVKCKQFFRTHKQEQVGRGHSSRAGDRGDKGSDALLHLSEHPSLSTLVRGVKRKFPQYLGNKGTINKFVAQSQNILSFVPLPAQILWYLRL